MIYRNACYPLRLPLPPPSPLSFPLPPSRSSDSSTDDPTDKNCDPRNSGSCPSLPLIHAWIAEYRLSEAKLTNNVLVSVRSRFQLARFHAFTVWQVLEVGPTLGLFLLFKDNGVTHTYRTVPSDPPWGLKPTPFMTQPQHRPLSELPGAEVLVDCAGH